MFIYTMPFVERKTNKKLFSFHFIMPVPDHPLFPSSNPRSWPGRLLACLAAAATIVCSCVCLFTKLHSMRVSEKSKDPIYVCCCSPIHIAILIIIRISEDNKKLYAFILYSISLEEKIFHWLLRWMTVRYSCIFRLNIGRHETNNNIL